MSTTRTSKRRRLLLALRIAISLTLLLIVLWKAHVTRFVDVLSDMNPTIWALGLAVGVVSNVVSALQWQVLLHSERIRLPFGKITSIYFMGHTFNQLLPSSIGGDVAKAVYVGRFSKQGMGAASATLMARVVGLCGLLLTAIPPAVVAALILPSFGWTLPVILLGVGVAYAVGLTVLLTSHTLLRRVAGSQLSQRSMGRKLLELAETVSRYRTRRKVFILDLLVSLCFYATGTLNFYVYGQALHMHTPLWFYWIAIPLTALATTIPISLNGYGVRGATIVILFALMGETAASSASLALLMELQLLLFALVGIGILFHLNRELAQTSMAAGATDVTPAMLSTTSIQATTPLRRTDFMADGHEADQHVPVLTQTTANELRHEHGYGVPAGHSVPVLTQATTDAPEETSSGGGAATTYGTETRQEQPHARSLRLGRNVPRRRSTVFAILAALVLVAVVVPIGVTHFFKSPQKVQLYTVSAQPLTSYVGGGGVTFPTQSLNITYPVATQVLQVKAQVGQSVQVGQPLLTLDAASISAQLDQAYSQWQVALDYVNRLYSVGASSTQIAAAQEQAALAKSKYDALSAELSSPAYNNGTVSAPFAGVVTNIEVGPGSLIHSGQTLVTVQNIDSLIVHAQFPIDQVSQVKLGAPVEIDPAAAGSKSYRGTVTSINPALSKQGSATFESWITVPNQHHDLFTGQSVYARVSTTQTLLTVPEVAVINPQSDSIVFVYGGGHAHLRHVVVGPRDVDRFGILSGLQAGDQIIMTGQYALSDNDPVTVRP